MQSTAAVAYTGPRPSPARRWAPALVVALVAVAAGNVILFALNLIERHNLQRAKVGHPVSRPFFDDTLSSINGAGKVVLAATVGLVIVGVVWSTKRRSPRRRREAGESAVEPSLGAVSGRFYAAFWIMFAFSILASEIARSRSHVGMTIDDIISYRGYIAAAGLFRAAMWGSYAALVVKATKQQDRREAVAPSAVEPMTAGA